MICITALLKVIHLSPPFFHDCVSTNLCPTLAIAVGNLTVNIQWLIPFTDTFTFSHLADAFVKSDVQGREYSSYEQ